MDKLKIILTLIVAILSGLGLLVVIGFLSTAIVYIFILGIVCLGGYVAFRLFARPQDKPLAPPAPHKELDQAQRVLDEYKRKLLNK